MWKRFFCHHYWDFSVFVSPVPRSNSSHLMSKEKSEHASKWSFARFQKKNPHAEPTQLKQVTVGDVWMYNVAILRALQKDYENITHRSIFARHIRHFAIFQSSRFWTDYTFRITVPPLDKLFMFHDGFMGSCNVFMTSPGCRSQLLSLRRVDNAGLTVLWVLCDLACGCTFGRSMTNLMHFVLWVSSIKMSDGIDVYDSLMGMSSESALQILSTWSVSFLSEYMLDYSHPCNAICIEEVETFHI